MGDRVTWGIYKGFNPHADPTEDWSPPSCLRCGTGLLPWVDWVSHGCVGYCPGCRDLVLVWSDWEPHPGFHSRQEKYRLIAHHATPLQLASEGFGEDALLWEWHQAIPSSEETIRRANRLRLAHSGESERLVVLEHLLWTIIWNTDRSAPELLDEYLRFAFRHPHFVRLEGRDVFMGYEVDLAVELERRYGERVLRLLQRLWEETRAKPLEFRRRLGLYFPTDDRAYEGCPEGFLELARGVRRRLT
ncbi:hypothetical protein JW921_06060 [Candidatus Fermentibacterales bacterium]|nr:hypothetical protein [Candidatus Fermentibacterales bacterium]